MGLLYLFIHTFLEGHIDLRMILAMWLRNVMFTLPKNSNEGNYQNHLKALYAERDVRGTNVISVAL